MVDADGPREPPIEPAAGPPPRPVPEGADDHAAAPAPGDAGDPAPELAHAEEAAPAPGVAGDQAPVPEAGRESTVDQATGPTIEAMSQRPGPEPAVGDRPPCTPEPPAEDRPTRTLAFELPTARHVVGSGLALAIASTREIRRASIYIGLLVLGAFGPAIVAALLILGRLGDGALDALAAVFGVEFGAPPQPALEAALLIVTLAALVGLLLFVSISIDAQVIAIALLGSRATDRPLRLWEAIVRARQAFWRMAGAGTLVGIIGFVIQSLIITALGGFSRSDEATSIAAALLATLVTTPLAYVSTSIVLGDVGAMEALSRSWRLFRARRLLALVVTLFTLVASAIQLFAFSAGIDLVARVADFLHLSLAEGAVAFATAGVLILAGVVAYGSLTFTIGAVVAAPQVTGFLGLTFFSGGLDKARGVSPKPPPGFRYVTRPMLGAFVVLAAVVVVQVPAIQGISPSAGVLQPTAGPSATRRPPATRAPGNASGRPAGGTPSDGTAVGRLIQEAAIAAGVRFDISGKARVIHDDAGDAPAPAGGPAGSPGTDLQAAEYAFIEAVPPWLIDAFDCDAPQVACDDFATVDAFQNGAIVFVHRVNGGIPPDAPRAYAVLLDLGGTVVAGGAGADPFQGASSAWVVSTGGDSSIRTFRATEQGWHPEVGNARARWRGSEVVTLIPFTERAWREWTLWGLAVFGDAIVPGTPGLQADATRRSPTDQLRAIDTAAEIVIAELE